MRKSVSKKAKDIIEKHLGEMNHSLRPLKNGPSRHSDASPR
jgi:hypothetical protein